MGPKMKITAAAVVMLAVVFVLTASSLLVHGQTKGSLGGIIAKLNATPYRMTAFDKALLDFNISEAFSFDPDIKGAPIIWNPMREKFRTHFFIPSRSAYLKMSSKEQYEQFEAKINGIRIGLIQSLGFSPGEFYSEIGKILEVEFVTNEGNQFYIIGRFKDGKMQLVREKQNMPKL